MVPPVGKRIFGRLRGRVVKTDHRVFGLKQFDTFKEIFAPEFAWRHVHQMLDVDGRNDAFLGAVGAVVCAAHTDALIVFDDELGNRLIGEDHAVVSLDEASERDGERS